MARRPTYRPWTRLIALAVVIVAAFAGIAIGGYSPKLGLDLSGGTTVTLQPKTLVGGQRPSEATLDQAVDILRKRVNGNGVSEAEVVKQSPYIVISVPSSSRKGVLDNVQRTAQLYFRENPPGETQQGSPDPSVLGPAGLPSVRPSGTAAPSRPSGTAVATPAPSATGAAPAAPSQLPPASVAPATASAAPASVRGRPPVLLAAAPTAAGPTAAAPTGPAASVPAASVPAASVPAVPPAGASARPPAPVLPGPPFTCGGAPVTRPAPGAPLPGGTDPICYDEQTARAAFTAFKCGDRNQAVRAADFAPQSWAFACARNGAPAKYILMPAAVLGTDVKDAQAQPQTNNSGQTSFVTGQWVTTLQFKNDKFAALTAKTATSGAAVAIVLDGVVESDPTNSAQIAGPAEISGQFTQQDAQDLANNLKFGSLPLSFKDNANSVTISPSLGKDSLHAGLIAGLIGLAIVIVYCLFYYRALGIVTILSLVTSGLMIYASVVLLGQAIGFTLSLAGIAGFIVAVGITADSFVVYYERIKDEVREGKAPRVSAEKAWVNARRTILSADAVSILAALVLYVVSVGSVRGFALTLGLSTVLDLVTVFFFTKPIVTLLIRRPFFSAGRASGLTAATPAAPLRRRRPPALGPNPQEA